MYLEPSDGPFARREVRSAQATRSDVSILP